MLSRATESHFAAIAMATVHCLMQPDAEPSCTQSVTPKADLHFLTEVAVDCVVIDVGGLGPPLPEEDLESLKIALQLA